MRLDKFLKVARILKRRTIANEAASAGKIEVNGRVAKPSAKLSVGDIVAVHFASGKLVFEVLDLKETVKKDQAQLLYKVIAQ
ncbi:MAG: RNA-binding S4 domain-containing protein [Clostridia bacterium]|nr:RNA-binding S4 domain-containing protein [Clostridia bacterium]